MFRSWEQETKVIQQRFETVTLLNQPQREGSRETYTIPSGLFSAFHSENVELNRVHDSCCGHFRPRQAVQQNSRPNLNRTPTTHRTSLRVCEDHHAWFREPLRCVQAGESDRNVARYASARPDIEPADRLPLEQSPKRIDPT